MTSQRTAHRDALAIFTSFPLAAMLWLGALLAAAVVLVADRVGTTAVAVCHGEPMSVDALCERRRRRSVRTYSSDYERMLHEAQARLTSAWVTGAVAAVLALLLLAALVIVWRRDVALAATFAQDRPDAAHAARTAWRSVLVAVVAVPMAWFGTWIAFLAGGWGQWVALTVTGALVLWLVTAGASRGSSYVGAYHDGIRRVRGGRLTGAPWSRVRVYGVSEHGCGVGIEGETGRVSVNGPVAATIATASNETGRAVVLERLTAGETVDLDGVTLTLAGVSASGRLVPWGEVAAAVVEKRGKHRTATLVLYDPARTERAAVAAEQIGGLPVLDEALAQLSGIRIWPSVGV